MATLAVKCPSCGTDLVLLLRQETQRNLTCDTCGRSLVAVEGAAPAPVESMAPPVQRVPASPIAQTLRPTTELPPLGFKIPQSTEEIFSGGGSALGLSAITGWLSCPERSRLHTKGVRRKGGRADYDDPFAFVDLSDDPLGFGTFIHILRAVRIIYGSQVMFQYLNWLQGIDAGSIAKANNMFKVYDNLYPLEQEPFRYLGVEVEVITDIGDGRGGSLMRTVRYDSIIQSQEGALFSFEAKTAARSGTNQLGQYSAQKYSHAALWNNNAALVKKYGPMRGTIYDLIAKTEVPNVERIGPQYVSKLMQQRAIEYLRMPDLIAFPRQPDGSFARLLHTCWGRFRPCEYIALCFEDAHGDYVGL